MEFRYGDIIEITSVPSHLTNNILIQIGAKFKLLKVIETSNLTSLLGIDANGLIWINSSNVQMVQYGDLIDGDSIF